MASEWPLLTGGRFLQVIFRTGLAVYIATVKAVLTATSEQRPPANNGQSKPGQIKFNINFDLKPSKERPSMYNGHYFWAPRLVVVDRFDCILISDMTIVLLHNALLYL
jgi:hypothetical protein